MDRTTLSIMLLALGTCAHAEPTVARSQSTDALTSHQMSELIWRHEGECEKPFLDVSVDVEVLAPSP